MGSTEEDEFGRTLTESTALSGQEQRISGLGRDLADHTHTVLNVRHRMSVLSAHGGLVVPACLIILPSRLTA
jgi:hypothetical protein